MDIVTNISTMTDDQLGEYVMKLSSKLAIITRLPSGSGAVEQIQRLLYLARLQMQERAQAAAFKQLIASRPAEIISDPDMMPKVDDTQNQKPSKPQINRVQVRRSDRPTNAIDLTASPPVTDESK